MGSEQLICLTICRGGSASAQPAFRYCSILYLLLTAIDWASMLRMSYACVRKNVIHALCSPVGL